MNQNFEVEYFQTPDKWFKVVYNGIEEGKIAMGNTHGMLHDAAVAIDNDDVRSVIINDSDGGHIILKG